MQLLGYTDGGEPIYASPSNKLPHKRVRRNKLKRARNEYQRENVLTDRDCLLQSQRALTETERAAAKCNNNALPRDKASPQKLTEENNYRIDSVVYEGNHKINHHDYSEVVTHPVTTFDKDTNYQHGKLRTPEHLWCDTVHASDSDTLKGERYHSKSLH